MSYKFKYKVGDIIGWYSSINKKYHKVIIVKSYTYKDSHLYKIKSLNFAETIKIQAEPFDYTTKLDTAYLRKCKLKKLLNDN